MKGRDRLRTRRQQSRHDGRMLPPERGRAILGAPPPRGGAGAVRRITSAGPGDAVEAPVRRAAIRCRVGPQSRDGQRRDAASKYSVAFASGRAVAAATRSVRRRMRDSLVPTGEPAFYAK